MREDKAGQKKATEKERDAQDMEESVQSHLAGYRIEDVGEEGGGEDYYSREMNDGLEQRREEDKEKE